MLVACMLILAVAVGGISTATDNVNTTKTSGAVREARYNRNEKPVVLFRPVMGSQPGEKMFISRQFAVNPSHSSTNHHPYPPIHLHPGQSGDFHIKRSPSSGSGPPSFVLSAFSPQAGGEQLFQSPQSPQNRPPQSAKPQLLRLQQQYNPNSPQHRPQTLLLHSQSPQSHQSHPAQQQYRNKPPSSSSSSTILIKQSAPSHNKPSSTILRSKPPINQFHGPPQSHNNGKPLKVSQKEFRASQPIPSFDQLDATRGSHLLASDEHIYPNLRSRGPSAISAAHSTNKFLTFTSGDNYLGDTSNENTWKPAVSSHSYPKHTTSAEIQQYQTQERISFYPDVHPEYFQTGNKGSLSAVEVGSIAGGSNGGAAAGKRKKLRRRLPSSSSASTQRPIYVNHNPTTTQIEQQNIRPIYEFQSDDVRPFKRHVDPDFTADSRPEGNMYQSVSVSTSLQTTAGSGPAAPSYDSSSSNNNDNSDAGFSLFVTPAKPDINDYDRSDQISSTTARTVASSASLRKAGAATTTRAPRLTAQQQRKLNNRVFRRKFVPPPSADNDTCIGSCLSTIISHVNDPVCGSDDRTYENVGRLRCTKLCGDQHLHVVHFGDCENTDDNNQLN